MSYASDQKRILYKKKKPAKSLRSWAIAIVLTTLGFIILQHNPLYHLFYKIKTYEGWSRQLLGGDHPGFVISFNHQAIRADFMSYYSNLMVAAIAERWLDKANRDDEVVKELERLKMIGTWVEDNDICIANELLLEESELGLDEFSDWKALFLQRTNSKWLIDAHVNREISDQEYCIWMTIVGHFQSVVLKGPDQRSTRIPLEFTFKKEFR